MPDLNSQIAALQWILSAVNYDCLVIHQSIAKDIWFTRSHAYNRGDITSISMVMRIRCGKEIHNMWSLSCQVQTTVQQYICLCTYHMYTIIYSYETCVVYICTLQKLLMILWLHMQSLHQHIPYSCNISLNPWWNIVQDQRWIHTDTHINIHKPYNILATNCNIWTQCICIMVCFLYCTL